ncbi:MAG: 8-amino-7-oxononanoate synthase [Akkermansiaceae bacterium]|nr:8-amino-7-oxononanoate synthase [Akkermansiaceae bacterium]
MRDPEHELAELSEAGLRRHLRPVDAVDPPFLTVAGRRLLNFSSNDYLGLAAHPALQDAAAEGLQRHGSGSTASRLVCGSLRIHHELEETIARLKGSEAALAFSSGYAAAVGAVTALVRRGDTVILDKLCHASLVDGARLSGATVRVYPHNKLDKLERLLASARARSGGSQRILVITESVFSMDGDRAPLEEIVTLKDRHDALLLVDEAHAVGVLGPTGQGLAEELGVADRIDLQLGTLGKAVGSAGGYLAAKRSIIDLLVNKARSFIYSTAPPPAQAAAARAGLELIAGPEGARLRERLWERLRAFAARARLPAPESAILPRVLGDNDAALAAAAALLEAGFLVPAMRFPTVPRGTARLRITISAAHGPEHLEALAKTLENLQETA